MRVLLINPKCIYDTGIKYSRLFKILPPYMSMKGPPLGLAYIGAVLEKLDNDIAILDANALNLDIDDIIKFAKDFNPEIVGITCQMFSINACLAIGKAIKKEFRNIKLILGGPVFISKLGIRNTLKNSFVDIIVIGEGEKTIIELINTFKSHGELSKINGICYKKKNRIIFTPARQLIENLDSLPYPSYHLLPMEKYKLNNYNFFTIFTSRGCAFDCKFCVQKFLWGRKPRFRSAKNVVDEIEYLYFKYNTKLFKFADDTFTLKTDIVENICKEIIKRNLKIKWTCQTRVDIVNNQILKLMKESGCISIAYGVESGSEKTLKYIGKSINLTQIKKAFELTRKNGIYPQAALMVGFPHENEKEIRKTVEFAIKLRAINYALLIFTPVQKTPLYNDIKRKGFLGVPTIKTRYLSSKNLIKVVNREHSKLVIAGLLNLFINTAERVIQNPLEIFQIFKEFMHIL